MRCWLQVPGRLRPICSCRPWTSGAHLRTTMTLEHTCHRAGRRRKATCESTNALSLRGTKAPYSTCVQLLHRLKLFLLSCNIYCVARKNEVKLFTRCCCGAGAR